MTVSVIVGFLALLCFYLEFFLPGGTLAILGAVLLVGSSIAFCIRADSFAFGFIYVVCFLFGAVAVCYLALRQIRKSGRSNTFFLQSDQKGFHAGKIDRKLLGKEGTVTTELKPAGHIRIEGAIYQAVSQGPFLPRGTEVEVVEVKGSHVLVKPLSQQIVK